MRPVGRTANKELNQAQLGERKMSWKRYEDAAERGPMSFFWTVLGPILVIILVVGGIGFFLRVGSQPARIIEQTMDADNVLYNYEWFKTQYNDVLAKHKQIKDAKAAVEGYKDELGPRRSEDGKRLWSREETIEYDRLNSIAIGLEQERDSMVSEYNARSQMANRSIFKSGELPETLSLEHLDE